jgi:hypothetical protein
MSTAIGKTFKTNKVDVKRYLIILTRGILVILVVVKTVKPRNSNRNGGAHKSRKSDASKQNKKRWY